MQHLIPESLYVIICCKNRSIICNVGDIIKKCRKYDVSLCTVVKNYVKLYNSDNLWKGSLEYEIFNGNLKKYYHL